MSPRRLQVFLLGLLLIAISATASVDSPQQAVQSITDKLLAKLVEVQPLYAEDPDAFFDQVETSLTPFIDFSGFARGVMAKYYRRASDEQKARFELVFREQLIRTYAKALVEFDNQRVEVVDKTLANERPGRASVDLLIYGQQGAIYTVNYSLVLIDDQWMLRNVSIEGINIGLQFRSQFAAYMDKYRNNIDEVIANWRVDV